MAVLSSRSSSSWTLKLRFVFASTAVLSTAVLLKFSVPVMADFAVSEVPRIYSFVHSCLRPPYLYILVNFIIISIVASSKLQSKVESAQTPLQAPVIPPTSHDLPVEYDAYREIPLQMPDNPQAPVPSAIIGDGDLPVEYDPHREIPDLVSDGNDYGGIGDGVMKKVDEEDAVRTQDSNEEVIVLKSVRIPERNASMELSFLNLDDEGKMEEKPRVSSRIPPRKPLKSSSTEASKPLGVSKAKPKRHDTLESTWKTITDGRSMPLTRHLKKSDTWDTRQRQNDENTPPPRQMKKSETFNDSSTGNKSLSPSPRREPSLSPSPRREPSLSQDELNRRVEAFIKKFNEDMRLQRQESLNQYQEMVTRGGTTS